MTGRPPQASEQPAFQKGIAFFNRQQFFEAHECWEDLWREEATSFKEYLQGWIHLAVAFHKLKEKNHRGAAAQLSKAKIKIEKHPEYHLYWNYADFQSWFDRLQQTKKIDAQMIFEIPMMRWQNPAAPLKK